MRLSGWASLAIISLSIAGSAATRPRYGNKLRIEMHSAIMPAHPADSPVGAAVFETLVRISETGHPEPWLAVSWEHDADFKKWQFHIRPGVKFHDSSPLTAAGIAAVLQPTGNLKVASTRDV